MKNNLWMQAFSENACPLCQMQCSAASFPLFLKTWWRQRVSLLKVQEAEIETEIDGNQREYRKTKGSGCKAVLYYTRLHFLKIDPVYSTVAFWFGQKRTDGFCKVCEIQHTQYKMEDWEIFNRIGSLEAISVDSWAQLSIKCQDLIFKLPKTTLSNLQLTCST